MSNFYLIKTLLEQILKDCVEKILIFQIPGMIAAVMQELIGQVRLVLVVTLSVQLALDQTIMNVLTASEAPIVFTMDTPANNVIQLARLALELLPTNAIPVLQDTITLAGPQAAMPDASILSHILVTPVSLPVLQPSIIIKMVPVLQPVQVLFMRFRCWAL